MKELGHDALVANACKLHLIHRNEQKSDEVDAELLDRLCRFDPQLLYPICHKGEEARAAVAVIRTRDALVRSRTLLINHARGIVKPTGHRLPKCASKYFGRIGEKLPVPLSAVDLSMARQKRRWEHQIPPDPKMHRAR